MTAKGKKGIYVKWQCLMNRYYECVENCKSTSSKLTGIWHGTLKKTDTFHVISALWHGFPIVLTDFDVSKCVTVIFHIPTLRRSGLKPCRYCIPISHFWLPICLTFMTWWPEMTLTFIRIPKHWYLYLRTNVRYIVIGDLLTLFALKGTNPA